MATKQATLTKYGRLVFTRGVNEKVAEDSNYSRFALDSLRRHIRGGWGDLSAEDKAENEYALDKYLRIFSVYKHSEHGTLWIITEADRSATTLLLPEEY